MIADRENEKGFVLVAAIWFVALLALLAVVIGAWMTRSLGLATRLQGRLTAHLAETDAENEVGFRLLSGFFSVRGLEQPRAADAEAASAPEAAMGYQFSADTPYIALDGRPYLLGSTIIRLQDDRGLYTLNYPNPVLLGSLLRAYGVSYAERGALISRLADYGQKSDLHRLNGASPEDYEQAGRPPPRGEPLLTPWEPLRVLSWNDYPALWRGSMALPAITTVGSFVQLNPNTAPKQILASLPGMDEQAAARVIQYRQRFVIENAMDLDQAAGVTVGIDPMSLLFFPADSVELTIEAPGDPLVHRLQLRLTPRGVAPYRIGYAVALAKPKGGPSGEAAKPPELPRSDQGPRDIE